MGLLEHLFAMYAVQPVVLRILPYMEVGDPFIPHFSDSIIAILMAMVDKAPSCTIASQFPRCLSESFNGFVSGTNIP